MLPNEVSNQQSGANLTAETLMTRARVAGALTEAGYPIRATTLATKATRGGGPPYRVFSGKALYKWGSALSWAQAATSAPRTSELASDQESSLARKAAIDLIPGSVNVTDCHVRAWNASATEANQ